MAPVLSPHWISLENSVPEQYVKVLFLEGYKVRYGYLSLKGWVHYNHANGYVLARQKDVTHWMTLP